MAASTGRILLISRGDYNPSTEYYILDIVRDGGKTWVCKQTCTGQTPQGGDYWQLMASDGADGTNSYIYIRYSANADGSDFVSAPTEQTKYVGFYTGDSETAPTNKTSYAWSKYVGEDGTDGEDGTNTYTYIRYSASADGTGFVDTPTSLTIYIGFYAGTSATAPTDKTEYTWSKYVGESGSGAGDMLKSEFATNGKTGVVDTSNRLRKYGITNSGPAYVNQWTKIAGVTFNGAWQSAKALFSVMNTDDNYGNGIFSIQVSVGGSAHRTATIKCISADKEFKPKVGNFKIIYTAPTYELWFNPDSVSMRPHITVLNEYGGVNITWLENQPYQATQPSGTVVTATLMEDYLITDLTAETAIADTDYFMMHDTSAVANRKTLWSTIKSVLKAYFDTLYNKTASTTVKGGVKIGNGLEMDGETLNTTGSGGGTVINDPTTTPATPLETTNVLDDITSIMNNSTANQLAGALALKEVNSNLVFSTTEETICGMYDGKPLYRKCISGNSPSQAYTYGTVNHLIENVDKIFLDATHSYIDSFIPVNIARPTSDAIMYGNYCIWMIPTITTISIVVGSAYTSKPMKIFVEYTKTTD